MKEVSHGEDGSISLKNLESCINSDLANNYGNLCQRVLAFCEKNANLEVPAIDDLTEDDKIKLGIVEEKLKTNPELRSFFNGDNTETGRRHVFNRIFEEVFLQLVDDDIEFYNKYTKRDINKTLKERFYRSYLNYSLS